MKNGMWALDLVKQSQYYTIYFPNPTLTSDHCYELGICAAENEDDLSVWNILQLHLSSSSYILEVCSLLFIAFSLFSNFLYHIILRQIVALDRPCYLNIIDNKENKDSIA